VQSITPEYLRHSGRSTFGSPGPRTALGPYAGRQHNACFEIGIFFHDSCRKDMRQSAMKTVLQWILSNIWILQTVHIISWTIKWTYCIQNIIFPCIYAIKSLGQNGPIASWCLMVILAKKKGSMNMTWPLNSPHASVQITIPAIERGVVYGPAISGTKQDT